MYALPLLREWRRSRQQGHAAAADERVAEADAEEAFRDDLSTELRREVQRRRAAEDRADDLRRELATAEHAVNNAKFVIKLLSALVGRQCVELDPLLAAELAKWTPIPVPPALPPPQADRP